MTAPSGTTACETCAVRNPRDGSLLASVAVLGAADVESAVSAARAAQSAWGRTAPRDRARVMRRLAVVFEEHADAIAASVVAETGKPEAEALASVVVSVDLIRHYAATAPGLLARRRVSPGWMLWKRAWVEHVPVGVVGAIIPWNYPLVLAMDALTTALFAGNALVLKPSEFTPLTALMLPGLCVEAGLPEGLVQIVTGDARTGQALVRGGVDKILFTGSGASARSVMAAASESLTPVTMELGGKDPAIVLDDADLDRAARGVAFGAFFNAGQTCLSIERALVERSVYEAFCQRLVDVVGRLRVHPAPDSDVGPMITDMQRVVVTGQIQEALAGGARSLTGGLPDENAAALSPTLLVDVTDHMTVMNEETFGPVLCIVPVADETEAIRRANEGRFGLFASVWTGDVARGLRVGRALRAGGISINDSLSHYGVAALPMGGVGESGFGRRRGAEGLLDLTRTRSVLVDRLGLSREPWWFPYDDQGLRLMRTVLTLRARGPWKALLSLFRRSPSGGPR